MKNLIIIIGTIMLGVFVFNMMVGDDEGSLKNISKKTMEHTLYVYSGEEDL